MSLLTLAHVSAFYGPSQALFDVSLALDDGEVLALMGRNGMGKSTTVKVICRLLENRDGSVNFRGKDIGAWPAHKVARAGIGLVPEGRRCFAGLTVHENLIAAARPGEWDFAAVTRLFPPLADRQHQTAATLSGGEQQMLAIGRALMSRPEMIILDEPSLGLAPLIIKQIFEIIGQLREEGITVFLVEQNAHQALNLADRGYVLETGKIRLHDTGKNLLENPDVQNAYLGG